MEPQRINATTLRAETHDLMERVRFKGERFIVETFGRPMAVIISIEDFQRVREILLGHPESPASYLSTGEDVTNNVQHSDKRSSQT